MRVSICLLLFLAADPAFAAFSFIGFGAPPVVGIRVGRAAGVSTVRVNVPANRVGDGSPVRGNPPIFVGAFARHPFTFPFPVFTLSVDSSIPLTNGVENIPFTEMSWTARDGDIPDGAYTGSTSQVILGPIIAAFVVTDRHRFSYANTQVVSAGIYTGRVTYTAAVP